MPRMTLVRYRTNPDATAENERLSRAVFDQVRADAPADIAYALFRDGDDFIHLFVNRVADSSDVITETPSFHAYQADLASRCATPPDIVRIGATLVDGYGFGDR